MNRNPASSRSRRFAGREHAGVGDDDHVGDPVAGWNAFTIGTMVRVSALLPSKQPISKGNPRRSTSSPTTICGSTRRSLEYPTLRSSSSLSASKYSVVTS